MRLHALDCMLNQHYLNITNAIIAKITRTITAIKPTEAFFVLLFLAQHTPQEFQLHMLHVL